MAGDTLNTEAGLELWIQNETALLACLWPLFLTPLRPTPTLREVFCLLACLTFSCQPCSRLFQFFKVPKSQITASLKTNPSQMKPSTDTYCIHYFIF